MLKIGIKLRNFRTYKYSRKVHIFSSVFSWKNNKFVWIKQSWLFQWLCQTIMADSIEAWSHSVKNVNYLSWRTCNMLESKMFCYLQSFHHFTLSCQNVRYNVQIWVYVTVQYCSIQIMYVRECNGKNANSHFCVVK